MTEVLDDAIRSFLVELVDATPPPPEFYEIAAESGPHSHNVAAARRRWSGRRSGLVAAAVVCAVVVAIGLVVTLIDTSGTHSHIPATNSPRQANGYYKATMTYIVDLSQSANQTPTGFQDLAQITLFVTKGDVPDAVAAKLGGNESGPQLAQRITTKTDHRASTIAITAVARTPHQAVLLADTFGDELVQVLDQKTQAKFSSLRDELQTRLDSLNSQVNALIGQIAGKPPNADQLTAQLRALQNQYTATYDSYQQLATAGPPTSRFTLLEHARALRIDKTEYNTRRHTAT